MRTVEDHARVIADLLSPTPIELDRLAHADGLVLGEDLVATVDLPPFENSAMDGYAVRAVDVAIAAGHPAGLPGHPGRPHRHRAAARRHRGPDHDRGAAAGRRGRDRAGGTDRRRRDEVRIDSAPAPGVHVRTRGEDVRAGTVVLPAGTVIGPPQIGVAAALGFARLPVRRPLRVLVLSTGSELVEPGRPLGPGQIYESNAPMLAAAIAAIGGERHRRALRRRRCRAFRAMLDDAAADVDLIVTSGGVSAGAYEVVKDALTGHGIEFAKVAMQPGMPQGAGR